VACTKSNVEDDWQPLTFTEKNDVYITNKAIFQVHHSNPITSDKVDNIASVVINCNYAQIPP
jgi:hypothetical protein